MDVKINAFCLHIFLICTKFELLNFPR